MNGRSNGRPVVPKPQASSRLACATVVAIGLLPRSPLGDRRLKRMRTLHPEPVSRLWLPSPALAGCIFAAFERDTRGVALSDAERLNFYPASPLAMVSWIFEGTLHTVAGGDETPVPALAPPLSRLVFSGPQRHPLASWSPGAVHALSVVFYPDQLERLLGVSLASYVDRVLPAEAVIPEPILGLFTACFDAASADGAYLALETGIGTRWQNALRSVGAGIRAEQWIRALVARATLSKTGGSVRQIQRRIKRWTGRNQRELHLFSRVEEAFVLAGRQRRDGSLDLAGVACSSGFTDQSHMGRAVRRMTGFSPGHFSARIETDEAFWFYRLLEGTHLQARH